MLGSFLSGALSLVLGYAYPAYECYKMVELNKPQVEQLRFWCQYWILVAVLTVFDRVGESFISWLPMYSEAKLAFFIYLWYPKTRGTSFVYETFFRPYVAKHEPEIDRNLLELRTRAGDMVVQYSKSIVSYGQTRIFEILQYVASQSASQSSTPHPAQPRPVQQRPAQKARQTTSTATAEPTQQPTAPQPHARSLKTLIEEETGETQAPHINNKTTQPQSAPAPANMPSDSEAVPVSTDAPEPMQVDAVGKPAAAAAAPQEPSIEEAIRVTRGRLRKRFAPASETH